MKLHFNTQVVDVAQFPLETDVFPGDTRRVSVIVSNAVNSFFYIFTMPNNDPTIVRCLAVCPRENTLVMPYRDYGDAIRQPLKVSSPGVNGPIMITEVLVIP